MTKTFEERATIYICAASGSPTGPFAWVARTLASDGYSELSGSDVCHFNRLQITATISALNALPENSEVHVVCSDKYLIEYVIERLDDILAGRIKGWKKLKNVDLLPELARARDRHASLTTQVVPWNERDCEHIAAATSVQRLIDHIRAAADFAEPMPVHRAYASRKPIEGGEDYLPWYSQLES